MKILAVDDDASIRELLPLLLERSGYGNVTVAASGHDALAIIEAESVEFDCLFLDIQMPDMDGIELCTHVRRITGYDQTPIVMLTAMTERVFIERAFAAGATDYVTKPFDTLELGVRARNVEQLVKARRAAGTARTDEPRLTAADGIKNLVEMNAISNYLRQLSRAGAQATQLLAISLDNYAVIRAKRSSAEVRYALMEVAEAISATLSLHGLILAEAGKGAFVCASNCPTRLDPSTVETAIQDILDDRDLLFDDGSEMGLEVSVGAPMRPISSDLHNLEQAMDRALARAEHRSLEKKQLIAGPNIRDAGRRG